MEFITSPLAPTSPSILIIQQICSTNTRSRREYFLQILTPEEIRSGPLFKIEPTHVNQAVNNNFGLPGAGVSKPQNTGLKTRPQLIFHILNISAKDVNCRWPLYAVWSV